MDATLVARRSGRRARGGTERLFARSAGQVVTGRSESSWDRGVNDGAHVSGLRQGWTPVRNRECRLRLDRAADDLHRPDPNGMAALTRAPVRKCVLEYGGASADAAEAVLVPADVLIPAACEDLADEGIARRTTARLIVEGANLPTTRRAKGRASRTWNPGGAGLHRECGWHRRRRALNGRASFVLHRDPDDVLSMISTRLRVNAVEVLDLAAARQRPHHLAARMLAEDRVRAAMECRGQCVRSGQDQS